MRTLRILTGAFGLGLILTCILPVPGMAQGVWLPYTPANSITLEIYKVDWDDRIRDVAFASSALFLTGRYRISRDVIVVGEIPVSNYRQSGMIGPNLKPRAPDGSPSDAWQTVLGNPYFGVVVHREGNRLISEFGLRPSLVSEGEVEARCNGIVADIDRWESWLAKQATVRVRLGHLLSNASGSLQGQTGIGCTIWIPTGRIGEQKAAAESFLDLSGKLWYRAGRFNYGLAITARMWLSETALDINERTDFQAGFGVTADYGNLRPGLHLHVPLCQEGLTMVGEVSELALGFHVTVFFAEE